MSELVRLQILFSKYLDRACSPQEVEELIALLQLAEADDMLDKPMRDLWEQIKANNTTNNTDWDKMYAGIIATKEETISLPSRNKWWRYAAAAILIPVAGLGIYWFSSHKEIKNAAAPAISATAPAQKQTPVSGRQTIHLPDGSTVILNQGSKLNYPSAFSGKTRDVYLSGEGFFDIVHNPRKTFFVHTGKISVKVLGTAFNIKTSSQIKMVEVTVTRGKVQVLNEDKSIGILTASQQLSYTAATEAVIQTVVDTLPVLAWKPAEILFNDITMEEVVKRLEQRFDLAIEFENARVKSCRVSATFSEDDLPEEILAVVCAVSKSNYTISNKKIIIHGKGCN